MIRFLFLCTLFAASTAFSADRPNILWITSEDNGPQLGCYGDSYAVTPHLDALAKKSLRYTRAASNAPVCAPARTTVISGLYPPATGAEHMRSMTKLPEGFKMFPAYLREAGYYTTNNLKEDYNLEKAGDPWDESSGKAHWKNRPKGAPFFAVFNFQISHESQIRNAIAEKDRIHDPAKVRVRAYHPDTPEVRKDWAQYYDRITMMDTLCGKALNELEEAGLAEDTIILYWGDHGSGMPRSKRWPYNSGVHVPLMAHFPEKWKSLAPEGYAEGGTSDRMVAFVDLAPTMLSIAGIQPLDWMQGTAFAGNFAAAAPKYSHSFRGRMDERYDMTRTVMDQRYVYLRQYMPHRIYGQHVGYMFETPTTRVWHDLFHAGQLNEAQSHFWRKKPAEELYDLQADPDEVNNLAASPEHREVLERMRQAHRDWVLRVRDMGFLPEAEIHARAKGGTPYDYGHSAAYDLETIFDAAQLATSMNAEDLPAIVKLLDHAEPAVRYWGATGLLCHEKAGVEAGHAALTKALGDDCGSVAIMAAETLGRFGSEADLPKALDVLIARANQGTGDVFEAIAACNALDYLDEKAKPRVAEIQALPMKPGQKAERADGYVARLLPDLLAELGVTESPKKGRKK
jgi:arylsulfatase A-like enzyme